jgi:hypothetical protein
MATLEQLARMLRERDMKDMLAREAARKVQLKADQKAAADERAAARIVEVQSVRRGAWLNHLLLGSPKDVPFDFVAAVVPSDPNEWPPCATPENFSFIPKPKPAAEQTTSLHALLTKGVAR